MEASAPKWCGCAVLAVISPILPRFRPVRELGSPSQNRQAALERPRFRIEASRLTGAALGRLPCLYREEGCCPAITTTIQPRAALRSTSWSATTPAPWRSSERAEESRNYARTEKLGDEFTENFRLLADMAGESEDRESFELTTPATT